MVKTDTKKGNASQIFELKKAIDNIKLGTLYHCLLQYIVGVMTRVRSSSALEVGVCSRCNQSCWDSWARKSLWIPGWTQTWINEVRNSLLRKKLVLDLHGTFFVIFGEGSRKIVMMRKASQESYLSTQPVRIMVDLRREEKKILLVWLLQQTKTYMGDMLQVQNDGRVQFGWKGAKSTKTIKLSNRGCRSW